MAVKKTDKNKISKGQLIKDKAVKDVVAKLKNSRTLMIINIGNVPSKQFQDIKKTIREHALVRVAKKNIMLRVIKAFGSDSILPLEKQIKENCAFAISNTEGYELAVVLSRNKTPIFAKAGQIAVQDIEVKEGPTSLPPGPAISEFGALGVQVSVEDGKIAIRKAKVLVNKGGVIKENVASILQKLEIKPFEVGLDPIAIYDVQDQKVYTHLDINPDKYAKELSSAAGKSLGFAQKLGYICRETIGYFLAKANAHAEALKKHQVQLNKPEEA